MKIMESDDMFSAEAEKKTRGETPTLQTKYQIQHKPVGAFIERPRVVEGADPYHKKGNTKLQVENSKNASLV